MDAPAADATDANKRPKDPKPTGDTPVGKQRRPDDAGVDAAWPTTPVESDDETALLVEAAAPSPTNRVALVVALKDVRALRAHLSTPDVLVLTSAARGVGAFATPPFWRELFERDWPGLGPTLRDAALRPAARALASRGVWRSAEAALVTEPRPPGAPEPPNKDFYEKRPPFPDTVPRILSHRTNPDDRERLDGWRIRATLNRRRLGRFIETGSGWRPDGHLEFDETLCDCVGLTPPPWRRHGGRPPRGPYTKQNWETSVLFPFTTGHDRGPAYGNDAYVRAGQRDIDLHPSDRDEDEEQFDYDSFLPIKDDGDFARALRKHSNPYDDSWGTKPPPITTSSEMRLDVDLVRRSDGAVVRLASGTSQWRDDCEGFEALWEELVLANDPFCRLHARAVIDFEGDGPSASGLHLRFYDSSINQNGWDGGCIMPEGIEPPILCAILAKTVALYDMAAARGRLVSYRPYETPEAAAWRAATATILLAARRGDGLRALRPELVREIAAFAVGPSPRPRTRPEEPREDNRYETRRAVDSDDGESYEEEVRIVYKAPDRTVLTEFDKVLEHMAIGEDVDTFDWPHARSPPPVDQTTTDASGYLFVAQVRGFRPACARLHAVREDTTLTRRSRETKHHLVFPLEPRHFERETTATFASHHACRYLVVHVVRVADGAVTELPLTHYNLVDGQWPRSHGGYGGERADPSEDPTLLLPFMRGPDLATTVHPLVDGEVSFAKRGSRAHDGAQLPLMAMIALGAEKMKQVTAGTAGPALERDELRVNFKSRHDQDDYRYHVRLGPSPREEFKEAGRYNPVTKGGGLLGYIDELFQVKEWRQ